MSLKTMEVVECDRCHTLQKPTNADYLRFDGSVTLHRKFNDRMEAIRLIPAKADGTPWILCQSCASVILSEDNQGTQHPQVVK